MSIRTGSPRRADNCCSSVRFTAALPIVPRANRATAMATRTSKMTTPARSLRAIVIDL